MMEREGGARNRNGDITCGITMECEAQKVQAKPLIFGGEK